MVEKSLERVLKDKVEPIIEEAMQKFLGVSIAKVGEDISDRIESNPLINFAVDTALSFKVAKKFFKKQFFARMIRNHYGNISEVARISGVDRRSVHRAVSELDIDVKKVRKDMIRPDYFRKEAVDIILRKTFDSYKEVIHPQKLELMYAHVPSLSENIVKELPEKELTWNEAELEFERQYLVKALDESKGNVSQTARRIGLRYETLYRKIKGLGLR